MDNDTEKKLARYYDGELNEKRSKQVEQMLSESEEYSENIRSMARLGDLLRAADEENQSKVSFEGFDKRVMNSLETKKQVSFGERIKVWTNEFFEHRKVVWVPATSLAAAAVALLLAMPFFAGAPKHSEGDIVNTRQQTWVASTEKASPGSEAILVNRDEATGTSYQIEKEPGEFIGVIWISE